MKLTTLLVLATVLLFGAGVTQAAMPPAGTLSPGNPLLTYSSGPFTGANATNNVQDEPDCRLIPDTCDDFSLTVDIPASYVTDHPDDVVRVQIQWPNSTNDFDLYVQNPTTGSTVNSSPTGNNPEIVILPISAGIVEYRVRVLAYTAVNESLTGTITLGPRPVSDTGEGLYAPSADVFTCNRHLEGQSLVFDHGGDGEPAVKFDPQGNAWITGIAGVGGGIGLWKIPSTDVCAQTPIFLDNPDAGVGGGDTDIEIAPLPNALGFHNIYTSSLTLANVTSSTSLDGGMTFVPTFISTPIPVNDRQWNAAYGVNTLYLSWREGATQPGNTLVCARSSAAGAAGTFVGPFSVWTSPGVSNLQVTKQLGNMACDTRVGADEVLLTTGPDGEGNVYHGFTQASNEVWVAVSRDFGMTWTSTLVFQGALGATFDHIFTWVAVDRAGNVYTVWSDNQNVFYSASADIKTSNTPTWSQPIRVNNGANTKTSLLPMVEAGSGGRIIVAWYGTSAPSSLSATAQWYYFHARINNALNPMPTIEEVQVSDHVVHTGPVCQEGLNCTCCRELLECQELGVNPVDGSSLVTYGGAGGIYVTRQVAGVSGIDGAMITDNSGICPTLANGCTSPPPPEASRCILPGVLVATDPLGDVAQPEPVGTTQHDIEMVWVAEPYLGAGVEMLVFTMKVADLNQLPLNTLWTILWNNPVPGDPFPQKFVQMNSCDPLVQPAFAYGHVEGNLQTADGDAEGSFSPDGTIEIRIPRNLVGNPQPNQILGGIVGEVRLLAGAACTGLIQILDQANAFTTYTVAGNAFCAPHGVDCPQDVPGPPGDYPLDFVVNNPSTTSRTFEVSVIDANGWIVGGPVNTTLGPISPGSSASVPVTVRMPPDCAPAMDDSITFVATAADLPAPDSLQTCVTVASCDHPVPTVLTAFTATSTPDGVELLWRIASPDNVVAWNLYRSESAESAFERVNDAPISAGSSTEFRYLDPDVASGRVFYRLGGLLRDGSERVMSVLSVMPETGPRSLAFVVSGANPFRSNTQLSYTLPERIPVRIEVFTVSGQHVATLVNRVDAPGTHYVTLNSANAGGKPLTSGLYFVRLQAGADAKTVRVIALQ